MQTKKYNSPMANKLVDLYKKGKGDETMSPIALYDSVSGKPIGRFEDGDYVIFYDIRGEREVEITESLTEPDFKQFPVKKMTTNFATMIEYDPKLNVKVAFPRSGSVKNTLSEVVSKAGLTQFKVVESEKAVHLTYFLNGKNQKPFPGEDDYIIDSPKIHEFDKMPEMNLKSVSNKLKEKLKENKHDLFIVNFCNIDVVGHTEDNDAIKTSIKYVDKELGDIVNLAKQKGMRILITADHGTVEKRYYPEGAMDTGHTDSKVPFIFVDDDCKNENCLEKNGSLVDIAPTVLSLLGLNKPAEMSGNSLLRNYKLKNKKPVLLIILDGWGYREESKGNLIKEASPSNMEYLEKNYPFTTLYAAGEYVGMPDGTVGNSEAGHLHIGSGRVVPSDRLRIDNSLKDGSFFKNKAFNWAIEGAKRDNTNLHLLGIVSFYSSHGSLYHLYALIELAKKKDIKNLYIHSLLGRRGERPESGSYYIESVDNKCKEVNLGKVVSIIGRKWALDRENNWDRIEKAYCLFVYGEGEKVKEIL